MFRDPERDKLDDVCPILQGICRMFEIPFKANEHEPRESVANYPQKMDKNGIIWLHMWLFVWIGKHQIIGS